jgi:hypothetical protein
MKKIFQMLHSSWADAAAISQPAMHDLVNRILRDEPVTSGEKSSVMYALYSTRDATSFKDDDRLAQCLHKLEQDDDDWVSVLARMSRTHILDEGDALDQVSRIQDECMCLVRENK